MVFHPANCLSLCAGAGGLDMGLMLAEPGAHTRCYVEWNEPARDRIIAAQRAGYFATAPIWDDVTTFDGRPMRGAIDTIIAGYPCQPFSMAGQRRGADDERHLWPEIARIIREVEPRWVFLENVAGHVTLGAETVLRELWDMGFTPAAGLFSAAEVGAPHERLRWFCVAYRGDTRSPRTGREPQRGGALVRPGDCGGGDPVANAGGGRPDGSDARQVQQSRRTQAVGAGAAMDHSPSPRCDAARIGAGSVSQGGQCLSSAGRNDMADTGQHVDDAAHSGRGIHAGRRAEGHGAPDAGRAGRGDMADASRAGIFPPGPGDSAYWSRVLRSAPHLAPSASARDCFTWARSLEADGREWWEAVAEPEFRRMVDGLATRTQPLRILGNGVVPLVAAYAWRTLATAHGLWPVDMGAAEGTASAGAEVPV